MGAGTNWLLLRYLSSIFSSGAEKNGSGDADTEGEGEVKVVFLSFMRDMGFWREGARKIVCFFFYCFFVFLKGGDLSVSEGIGYWRRETKVI